MSLFRVSRVPWYIWKARRSRRAHSCARSSFGEEGSKARAHRIIGALLVLQGAGHAFVGGPIFFDSITQGAVWYLGAGLAIMLL